MHIPEKRKDRRHGLALRVLLANHAPTLHATTRNVSLGGMCLMTATRALLPGDGFTATLEVDHNGQRHAASLPVRVIWSNSAGSGVAFRVLPAETLMFLREVLAATRARRKRRPT